MKTYSIFTLLRLCILILIILFSVESNSQNIISGTVTEANGKPIEGANVFLFGTYDGITTNASGNFSFETSESGTQTLIISFVSFETFQLSEDISRLKNLKIKLRDDLNSLDTVIISAGTFEAGDNSKVSVLNAMDVVTTASALGDFVGALQTLPGTTTVAEDGRLFVRGGDARETQIFIDGLRVFTPFTPTSNNAPTRGRYSPFLFDGITFSTGGYSAEYGQALSSVLLLNTIDEPAQEETNINIMTVGAGLGHTEKWKKSSLSLNTSYINLAPYNEILPGRNNFQKPYEMLSGEAVFRQQFKNGLLKVYSAFDTTNFELTQEDINLENGLHFKLKNNNFYTNTSYNGDLSDSWKIFAGGSFTVSKDNIGIENDNIENVQKDAHLKLKLKKRFSNKFKISMGAEQFLTNFSEDFRNKTFNSSNGFKNNISSIFTEADYIFSRKFAVKAGLRGEYSPMLDNITISPRISLAYKTGKKSQLSLAYGDFYQQPESNALKYTDNLKAEMAQHYIVNYQYSANDRIFRAEAFRKVYNDLTTYDTENPEFNSDFSNNGDGYAQGLDLFFRDNQSLKNLDYWVSYSYLDSERKYRDYPISATPNFANTHNLSLVGKYWVEDWKSQMGFSYQYASGRTYTDLNKPGFLQEKTKDYNSLSLNWAYLIAPQKILYLSVNNVLGFKNINGYQYADAPNALGNFDRRALRQANDQFFFVGFFWTLSEDGTKNQLENL